MTSQPTSFWIDSFSKDSPDFEDIYDSFVGPVSNTYYHPIFFEGFTDDGLWIASFSARILGFGYFHSEVEPGAIVVNDNALRVEAYLEQIQLVYGSGQAETDQPRVIRLPRQTVEFSYNPETKDGRLALVTNPYIPERVGVEFDVEPPKKHQPYPRP